MRAIVVTGPHMIGKSRLVLEATRHRDVDVIEALDSGAITADSLHRLAKSGRETIVLLQDAAPEVSQRAIRDALALGEAIKVILTVATRNGALLPNFGLDARTRVLQDSPAPCSCWWCSSSLQPAFPWVQGPLAGYSRRRSLSAPLAGQRSGSFA